MRIELITEISGEQVIGLAGLKPLADSGNVEALNILGEWMLMGYECSPDVDFAFKCFKKAAKKGNTQAMLNLGICYMNGYGVEEDFYIAERWIRAAHECGDKEAMAVCEQLYTTTIGDHKPDLKTFVDLVYDELSIEEKKGHDASVMKEMLLAQMILSASGVSDSDLRSLQGKVTENDIIAFETMNDIHYGEPVKVKKKIEKHVTKKQYCEMLVAGISEKSEEDLTAFIALLYNLCDSNEKNLIQEIKNIKYCFYTDFKVVPWLQKALYEVEPDMCGKFKSEDLKDIVAETIRRAEALDNIKIGRRFGKTNNIEEKLINLRNSLRNSNEYQDNIRDLWISKISKKLNDLQNAGIESVMSDPALTREGLLNVFQKVSEKKYELDVLDLWEKKVKEKYSELEEKEISEQFDEAYHDYNIMYNLLRVFKKDIYSDIIQTKWEPLIKSRLCELQGMCLEKLCENIENKNHTELITLLENKIKEFSFDRNLLDEYRNKILSRLSVLEKQDLENWCENSDNLSVDEITALIEMIEGSGYDKKNTNSYISQLEEKKENLIILDNCTVEKLEEDDLNSLNEKISAVHFSTLDSQTKEELTQRVNSYINLFHEGKDRVSNQIREKCSQEKLEKFTDINYVELIKEVQESRIQQKEKNEIVSRLKEQRKHKFLIKYAKERLFKCSFEKLKELEESLKITDAISEKEKKEVQGIIESRYKELNKIKFSSECSKNRLFAMDYVKLNSLLEEIEAACLDDKQMYADFVKKHIELYKESEKQCSEIYNAIADEVIRKVDAIMHPNSFVITNYKSIKGFYDRTQRDFVECIEEKSFKEKGLFEKVSSKGLALINGRDYIFVLTLDGFVFLNDKGVKEIPCSQLDKFKLGFFSDELILNKKDGSEVDKWQFDALRSEKKDLVSFFNQLIKVSTKSVLDFKEKYQQIEAIKKRFLEQRKAIGIVYENPEPKAPVKPTSDTVVQPTVTKAVPVTVEPKAPVAQPAQQVSAATVQPIKTEVNPVSPQPSLQQVMSNLIQVLNAVSEAKSDVPQPVQQASEVSSQPTKTTVAAITSAPNAPARQPIVPKDDVADVQQVQQTEKLSDEDKKRFLEYGNKLGIGHLLDFDNVSTTDYLRRYPAFLSSIKGIEPDEFGVVLIKNYPTDILLTNTSILWQVNRGNESFHTHPGVKMLNSICLKNGKIVDSIAASDYEICPQYDAATNECILAFLKYAALGVETDVKQTPQQNVTNDAQMQKKSFVESIDASKPIEIQISELKKKYSLSIVNKYHMPDEVIFAKKYPKAMAAYANVPFGEKALIMEDSTVFGSAKTGFVLTDRHVFIKISAEDKKILPIESVSAVVKELSSISNFYLIKLVSTYGNYTFTSFTDEAPAQKVVEFFEDVFELLKRNDEKQSVLNPPPVAEPKNEAAKTQVSSNNNTWTCQCGEVNTSNFCAKCGKKRETQVEMWKCSCGNECKGNFCNKCGNPRNK